MARAPKHAEQFQQVVIDAEHAPWWRRIGAGATRFPFVERGRIFFVISALVIVAGLGALAGRGLNLGIDFRGGVSWQVASPTLTVPDRKSVV